MHKFLKPVFFLFPTIFFGVFGLFDFSWAAPSITSAPSNAIRGQSITISGSEFGTSPIVYKWDDFEGGIDGGNITGWNVVPEEEPTYEIEDGRPGSRFSAFSEGNESFWYDNEAALSNFYTTWWMRRTFGVPVGSLFNLKFSMYLMTKLQLAAHALILQT